jgi:tRNA nucleotidyltransferase (CCA-adding enzyme)
MQLPSDVQTIIKQLTAAGFEAYAVGGCVRDVLLGKEPQDWDVTTSATPAEIQKLFPKNFYTNRFGTVTVLTESAQPTLKEIEVTTYRVDMGYSDQRHPDEVKFTSKVEEDLARRDFTINAMAMSEGKVIDPFDGQEDLKARLIRAVGNPLDRFQEDALRLLRGIRLAAQLNFEIEGDTLAAIKAQAKQSAAVSPERIRDELLKIVTSDQPEKGLIMLEQTGLLAALLPELQEGVGVGQNKHHIYTVFEHNVKSLQFAADYDYPWHIRLAALLHDIGKPRTKRKQGADYTFYGHEIVGARMAEELMKRLRFSTEEIKRVSHLVRHHMFYYDIGKVTEAGMRRLLRRVGPANFDDLIKLRIAERKGSGVPKARPYRLRHLQFLAEKVSQQPITVGQLAIRGTELIKNLRIKPGPIIGGMLNALLAEVIDDPAKNTREYLLHRAEQLKDKNPAELKALGQKAIEEEEGKRDQEIRGKYHV